MTNKHAGDYRRGRTRYQPLVDYLAARTEPTTILTLGEIEVMIGGPLSDTAYTSADAWTSSRLSFVQRWRAMGWRAHASPANRRVRFTRDAEPEEQ